MKFTYEEAAVRLGVSRAAVKRLVALRLIGHQDFGHRTKFITDRQLEEFERKHTKAAI